MSISLATIMSVAIQYRLYQKWKVLSLILEVERVQARSCSHSGGLIAKGSATHSTFNEPEVNQHSEGRALFWVDMVLSAPPDTVGLGL